MKIIGPENRTKLLFLQMLFLVAAVFQVASVAAIPPFIAMLTEPSIINDNKVLSFLYDSLGFGGVKEFIIAYAAVVTLIILLANSISGYSTWRLLKISMVLGAHVQKRIFNNYLDNDYSFFALNNSSRLTSQVTQEVPRMIYMVVQPMLNLISQLFIAVLIVGSLILVDVTIAFVAILLVTSLYVIIFKFIREKVVENGYKLSELNRNKLKILNESIGGIKEVKLRGNESIYKAELDELTVKGLNASAYISLAGDLPRFIVETVIFAAILILAIAVILSAGSTSSALSIVSLYAMAGYKLMPAAQTIYKCYSLIKANGMVVFELSEEIDKSERYKNSVDELGDECIASGDIVFEGVGYTYPGADVSAIEDCKFSIKEREITAFVGASGAGKSTCVDLLLGLLTPTKGSITVGGNPIGRANLKDWRSKIGYVAQDIFLLDGSFKDNIAFGERPGTVNEDKLIKAAKMANIHDFIIGCEGGYDFTVGERGAKLSGGQKQRIGIARALYKDPEVIIFDEATSALDNVTEHNILKDIHKLAVSKTIVMIAHRLSTVENADNIILFEHGAVVDQGNYSALSNRSAGFMKLLNAGSASYEGSENVS
jgi:ABC-type multidrug transport system fused ATPase/permease subunit